MIYNTIYEYLEKKYNCIDLEDFFDELQDYFKDKDNQDNNKIETTEGKKFGCYVESQINQQGQYNNMLHSHLNAVLIL